MPTTPVPDPVRPVIDCPFCDEVADVSRDTVAVCSRCGRDLNTPLAVVAQLQRLGREMAARAGRRW